MSLAIGPGNVLAGKYRVERVLGRGGMGMVVCAVNLALDKRVALKFLLPEVAQNPEIRARFDREARTASKIQSEHVAQVLDVGALEDGAPFMVMEYLEGSDLAQVVKARGPLPGNEALDYVLQACEALAEAHVAGIVHRDLKPANLFLARRADGSPCIKVLDFGISKVALAGDQAGGMTQTSAVMGSPNYMAPEQLKSSRNVDARTDIWALGMVLYELLTGDVAFKADTVPELYVQILQAPPQPLRLRRPDAPPQMEAILLRCLEKDPGRRFANVAELAAALSALAPESRASVERISRVIAARGAASMRAPAAPPEPVGPTTPHPQAPARSGAYGPPGGPAPYPAYAPPNPQAPAGRPIYGSQPFPPTMGAAPPAPPAQQQGMSGAMIALIALVALLVLGGGGCAMCLCIGAVGAEQSHGRRGELTPVRARRERLAAQEPIATVGPNAVRPFQEPAGWTTVFTGASSLPLLGHIRSLPLDEPACRAVLRPPRPPNSPGRRRCIRWGLSRPRALARSSRRPNRSPA